MQIRNIVVTPLAVMLLAFTLNSPAWSHASAKNSTPADGAVLNESPLELSIMFNAPAKLVSLTISASDADPTNIDTSNATAVDGRISVAISPLQPGSYVVSWRALGSDGHTTSGDFRFVVSEPGK